MAHVSFLARNSSITLALNSVGVAAAPALVRLGRHGEPRVIGQRATMSSTSPSSTASAKRPTTSRSSVEFGSGARSRPTAQVLDKFRAKYGARDVEAYYPKQDVAVEVLLA